ncbi:MAG: glycosyltransferase [Kiritimatiellae bacterium]|nr:glycosyltransferase [Kiritimatiellia bacterium]
MLSVGYIFNHGEIVGGGEISFIDLADAVRAHGVSPVPVVPGPGAVEARLQQRGLEPIHFAWPTLRRAGWLRFPSVVSHLARTLRETGVEMLHVNGARCMLYAGAAARRLRIPCVWHVRVLTRDPRLDRLRARWADALIANSGAVAESLKPFTRAGQTPTVIYNGLPIRQAADAPGLDLGATFGIGPGPVILAVGRFTRWKGFEDLLAACAVLNGKGLACTCLLAGAALPAERDYESELKATAVRLGLRNIVFAGWRDDVYSLMKAATVLAVPSHGEPFGRVMIEAWSCGLPVVATNEGGPGELIRDEEDGLLVPAANPAQLAGALARLLADADLRAQMAENGRARAKEFDLETHAKKVADLYRGLREGNKCPAR